jgi:putative flippase GtrA
MKKIKEFIKNHEVVVKYLIFGVLTTFVGWFVYFGILLGGKALLDIPPEDTTSADYLIVYTAAQILQWIAAVLFAFFTNKKWVFTDADADRSTMRQLGVFASGRIVTFFLDYGITLFGAIALAAALPALNSVMIFGKELNINEMSAKLVAAIIVVVSNYFFSKLLVFKKKSNDECKINQK